MEILRAALDWVSATPPAARRAGAPAASERILGYEPNERALRFGLERGYRALANLIPERRVEMVDMANSVRPGRGFEKAHLGPRRAGLTRSRLSHPGR